MKLRIAMLLCCAWALPSLGWAVDHRIEKLEEPPPADALSQEIVAQLNASGVRVVRGTDRAVCEIWLAKQWDANPAATAVEGVQYPFKPGQLIGAIRFPRKGSDFRDQDIAEGVYTLRYALQPIDGAHQGTFPTRDFLVMSKAESDSTAALVDPMVLVERGTEASDTAHPAIMPLLKVAGQAEAYPAIVHNEESDWWIARLAGTAKTADKTEALPLDVVVAGVAAE